MNWTRISRVAAPSAPLLTVDEAKEHLNVGFDETDDYIESLIKAATAAIEGPTGIGVALITQTWRMSFDQLCATFTIPLGPVQDIVSITYKDGEGTTHTVASDRYRIDTDQTPARVFCTAPIYNPLPGSVKVTFTTGYGDAASDVPADLRHAAKLLIGHFFENREASSEVALTSVPLAVESVFARYRA